jgi:MFS transporter, YNFM family, putative membrane transport protein
MVQWVTEAIEAETPAIPVPDRIARGAPAYRRARWALFAGGFTTFAMLYCVQPMMPAFAASFHIGAAATSLAVSVTTTLLAVAMPLAGALSEVYGRKGPMTASLFCAAALCLLTALAPSWRDVLIARTVEGLALACVPAVAIAYLSEEIEPRDLGGTIGLYVGGTAMGGMIGRLLTGVLMDVTGSWRVAMAVMALLALLAAVVFVRLLPPSRHFPPSRGFDFGSLIAGIRRHAADPVIRRLCVVGFLLMGSFVTIFNYISYRLVGPPYGLSQSAVGAIFLVYVIGIPAPPRLGALSGRIGHAPVLAISILMMLAGLAITCVEPLIPVIFGLALLSAGFFSAHTVASSWVGVRADGAKAQASSLYLFAYYVGSSIAGWLGGHLWEAFAWTGVAGFVGLLCGVALIVSPRRA